MAGSYHRARGPRYPAPARRAPRDALPCAPAVERWAGKQNRARGMVPRARPRTRRSVAFEAVRQTVNELPQPQPPVAFGFLNVKPEPIMVVT